jgi:hypothetical protein
LRPEYGQESIRYSLLILSVVGGTWSALHYYLASRTLEADLTEKDKL